MSDIIRKIEDILKENRISADVYQANTLPVIIVDITDGDWKHEHLRCNILLSDVDEIKYFGTEEYGEDEDGISDTFSAYHKYIVR